MPRLQTISCMQDAWYEVLDASEVKKYPEEDIKKAEENHKADTEQTAKDNDMELSDLLESWGMTEEDFDEECKSYAESKVEQNLIVQGIIDAEGLSLNDEGNRRIKEIICFWIMVHQVLINL